MAPLNTTTIYLCFLVLFNAPIATVVVVAFQAVQVSSFHMRTRNLPQQPMSYQNQRQSKHTTTAFLSMSNEEEQDDTANDRSEGLRKALMTVGEVADSEIKVGSTVVAGNNIPNLGIWQFQSYELKSIYDQGFNEETGVVEKLQRQSLQDPVQPATYTRYVTLYSEKYHKNNDDQQINGNAVSEGQPVVVSPNEVELSSLQTEVVDSVIMALPLFGFWTALAYSFANQYSERTGGTFVDALFGR